MTTEGRRQARARLGRVGVWAGQFDRLSAAAVRQAAAGLEDLDVGAVWIGEADGREALTHAGILLAATDELTVATGIASIWARDPQATVNAARTLEEAYPGRFVLGLGVSHPPLVSRRGHHYAGPFRAMSDFLERMERATYTAPPPDDDVVTMLAALGPRMLELAARRSVGALTFFVPTTHTREARQLLGPAPVLAVEQSIVVAERRAEARELAGDHVRRYLALTNYRSNLERLGWTIDDLTDDASDRLFDALVAWGSPEDITARVNAHLAAGADHVALHAFAEQPDRFPSQQLRRVAGTRAPSDVTDRTGEDRM